MHNVLIADFFKKEACTRKIGKTPRSRPRESDISSRNPKNVHQNGQSASKSRHLPISCDPHMAHCSKQTKISP
jgi:hypothetical protein